MQNLAAAYTAGLIYGGVSRAAGRFGAKALALGAVGLGAGIRKMVVRRGKRNAPRKRVFRKRGNPFNRATGTRGALTRKYAARMGVTKRPAAAMSLPMAKRRAMPRRRAPRPTGTMDTYLQYPKQNIGRGLKLTMRKMEKLALSTAIVRHQGINRLNAVTAVRDASGFITSTTQPGFYSMLNGTTAGTALPLHVMLLNSGVVGQTEANLQSAALTPQGNIIWNGLTCQTAAGGTTASSYQGEYQSSNSDPGRFIRYKWYDIRLCLYGAVTQPAIWDVYLVKFTQDELVPFGDVELNTSDTRTLANRSSFWQSVIKPATYHPMMPSVHRNRGMRVLKHKRINIPASSNDDLDVAPPCVQLRWFYRDGRMYDYHWDNPRLTDVTTEGPMWAPKTSNTQVQWQPRPKAGVYLMIRCSNCVSDADTVTNWNGVPTYDLCVRARRDQVQ